MLSRIEHAGLKLKRSKCFFMLPSVEFLGHVVSADGLCPTKEKVRAIVEAPAPQNVLQLRFFLGLVNYYSKFLPQLSSTLAPLHLLLQKNSRWHWGHCFLFFLGLFSEDTVNFTLFDCFFFKVVPFKVRFESWPIHD